MSRLTYILGVLCFIAITVSAVMLICSVNIRRLNVRFWSVFLCASLVCSFAFYCLHKSVSGKKTAPTIDFSGISPEIKQPEAEEHEIQTPDTLMAEIPEPGEQSPEDDTFSQESESAAEDGAGNAEVETDAGQKPQTPLRPDTDTQPERETEEDSADFNFETESPPETKSTDQYLTEDITQPVYSSAGDYSTESAPEIIYEGPFRAE